MPTYLKPKLKITDESFMTTLLSLSTKTPTVSDRPEVELLLCCARTHIDPETAERIRTLLQQDIDWAYLIQTAGRHGVIPLLYCNLNTTGPEAVPKTILNQLRSHFHTNALHNLFLTKELLKLLNLFETHDIKAIPFKGPILAASAYGNLALRQFCDLDILVHSKDFLRTKDLLISHDYQPAPTLQRYLLIDAQETIHIQSRNDYTLIGNDGKVCVDLHQRITTRHFFSFPLDFERLWSRLQPVSLASTTVLNLRPEDLLLILCVHGTKHLWERLGWICDVAELVRAHQEMDWQQLMEQARKLGCERMLLLGLFLASEFLGAALPEAVHQRIQADSQSKSLVPHVHKRLFCEAGSPTEGFSFEQFSFHFTAMERLQDKVHYCVGSLYRYGLVPVIRFINPTFQDQQFLPLPRSLYFLYYLIRPIRLLGKIGLLIPNISL
jgi:hypothetical protein